MSRDVVTRVRDYWIPLRSSADAVRAAKVAARGELWQTVRVVKVIYAPRDDAPAWTVRLELTA